MWSKSFCCKASRTNEKKNGNGFLGFSERMFVEDYYKGKRLLKVLFVDDDYFTRTIAIKLLGNADYEIKTAEDGEQAIGLLCTYKPDIIITDVNMPKLDGWTLCEKLRENPETKGIPIIMLTARQGKMSEAMSYQLGANAYLAKPINEHELLDTIKRLVQKA